MPERNEPKEMNEETPFVFSSVHSANVPRILKALNISLAVTSYQSGRLILIRSNGEELETLFKRFERPMGLYADRERITLGTFNQVLEFKRCDGLLAAIRHGQLDETEKLSRKVLEQDEEERKKLLQERKRELAEVKKADSLYLHRASLTTGMINIHDIGWGTEGLWVVNSTFSCLATLSPDYSFIARWRPPFITDLVPENRCHLNGMAMAGGRPRYVTTFNQENRRDSWGAGETGNGSLLDVESGEVVIEGLSMPHSPRIHNGAVYVCHSGLGEVWRIDPLTREKREAARLPGYTRGLTFFGDLMLVGTSRVRDSEFSEPPPLTARHEETYAGIWFIDEKTSKTLGHIRFEGDVEQIYDIAVIPESTMPELLDMESVLTRHLFDFKEEKNEHQKK